MLKGQKGITLIALVITIVVLVILAGVSISLVLGNESIFTKIKDAADKYQNAANSERSDFSNLEAWMANYINDGTSTTNTTNTI